MNDAAQNFPKKVFPVFESYIKSGDIIVVGVSGGPDSTALLDVLAEFSKKTAYKIIVAHLNHGIRGREADADEKFVEQKAKFYGFECEIKRVKLAGKSDLERQGRSARREFFEALREKYKAKWILTAHTEDDQLETIVMNFLRGSGLAGLAGMNIAKGFYLKPFLRVSKSEILAYLKSKKMQFCFDSTNDDTQFRRNFIRKKIMPLFAQINPSFKKTLLRNSAIFLQINKWLAEEAEAFLEKNKTRRALFSLKNYKALPEVLKLAVIQSAYKKSSAAAYNLPMAKMLEIMGLFEKGIGNKKITCAGGGTFLVKKGAARFME